MTKQEQIEEMKTLLLETYVEWLDKPATDKKPNLYDMEANKLYNAGYRKAEEIRKETAKEIFQKVVNICRKEEDFQDDTVNTQLEPLYFGIMNCCAFIRNEVKELAEQYSVEVEE